jgi:hypothetical protein
MSKQNGLGDNLYLGGYDIGCDIGSLSRISGGNTPIDVTSICQSAFERIGGRRDGGIDFTAYFNPAATRAHARLSTLPTTDTMVTYARGTTLGNPGACMIAKQINYDPTRAADGSLTFAIQTQANGYGLEWGRQLTAGLRTDTVATNGTSIDTVASASFGWTAYLQVTAVTGTSVTVTIEDSANNSVWATLSGGAFTAATGVTTQRLQSASATGTVRQYVRAVTTGTFTVGTFSLVFVKHASLVAY